ncbi:hypothetical protein ACLB2K_064327 [Fragaria x ananassa]
MFTRPMLKRKKEEEESALFWPPRKKNGVVPDSEKMHERRWENLGMDCITMVFARVGMESLILSLPFVCKSCEYLHSSLLACVCHDNLNKILEQIGIHCKRFMGLELEIEKVDKATALKIVKYLPDIKF